MNRIQRLAPAALALAAASLASCEDFLDRPPQDQVAEETFYQTEEDLRLAAYATYTPLTRQAWLGQEGWKVSEVPSDNTTPAGSDPDFSPIDNFGVTSDNRNVLAYWSIRYRAANLANVLVEKAPQTGLDAAVTDGYVAEGQFVRALAYFDLVRIFGGVPLVLEKAEFGDDVLLPRASVEARKARGGAHRRRGPTRGVRHSTGYVSGSSSSTGLASPRACRSTAS